MLCEIKSVSVLHNDAPFHCTLTLEEKQTLFIGPVSFVLELVTNTHAQLFIFKHTHTHLPNSNDCIGNQDEQDDYRLHKGRSGLLAFLKQCQHLGERHRTIHSSRLSVSRRLFGVSRCRRALMMGMRNVRSHPSISMTYNVFEGTAKNPNKRIKRDIPKQKRLKKINKSHSIKY